MLKPHFLAKRQREGEPTPTVSEHSLSVQEAEHGIFASIEKDLTALEIAEDCIAYLKTMGNVTAGLHDIAKINSSFQAMLQAKPGSTKRQPVRHEIIAAWLLSDLDFFGHWLMNLRDESEIWPVVWAIAGHHLKMDDPCYSPLFNTGSGTARVSIPLSEMHAILCMAFRELQNNTPPKLADIQFDTIDDIDEGLEQRIAAFAENSCRAWKRLIKTHPNLALRTALLKALLISADVAGSALVADSKLPSEWITQALSVRLNKELLDPVIKKGTKGREPLPFQEQVGNSGKQATIVIAGCGNGKTTAAYLWAQRHAVGKKLWFTYPTTGTASAGYEGYLYDHPDLRSILIHGRAEVDLEAIQGTSDDDPDEESVRLDSLRAWNHQAIACTVDTVLGLFQNQRRPLFSFPAIAAGAFVFDEIHSYDPRMFGALLCFLKTFPGAPVLLMSASIPPRRLKALQEVLGDRVGPPISGDVKMEGYKRYCLKPRLSATDCRKDVAKALRDNKKVLWVCNTVSDAVQVAREACKWSGLASDSIIIYHARFRYKDRVERQKQVLDEFAYYTEGETKGQRRKPGACLVITTQVCEMSLDISADLMVVAECPLPSLVQRLGRLNRYAVSDDPWTCLVYPFHGEPYNEEADCTYKRSYRISMAAAREAVKELAEKPCSQSDLAERLEQMLETEEIEGYSAWLKDGWLTVPSQLREGSQSITLIREDDFDNIKEQLGPRYAKRSRWNAAKLASWTIPMSNTNGFYPTDRVGGYPVAAQDTITYSNEEGAAWANPKTR
jgi:CRISPR-associated endonuclease/helicase Cas3